MPYYIHNRDENPAELDLVGRIPYASRQEAFAHAQPSQKIAYLVADTDESMSWQIREQERFNDGQYLRTPWWHEGRERHILHYCHQSLDKPGMVAYTRDDEQGYLDRQVRTTPGRYLEQFYSDVELSTRQRWIAICQATDEGYSLARTADEIERVYRACDYKRPFPIRSCMGPEGHAEFDIWPCRVYGDSDLAVAYLGPMDAPIARGVVWPAKKVYRTIYGDEYRLTKLLCKDGYSWGSMHGAKVRKIEHPEGGYVMPYVDGVNGAHVSGRYIVLGSGPIATDHTTGRAGNESTCEHCHGTYSTDEDGDDDTGYCPTCEADRSYCDNCQENCWDGRYVDSIQEYRCDGCIADEARQHQCEACGENFSEWAEEQDTCHDDREIGRFINRVCQSCVEGDEDNLPVRICHCCDEVVEDTGGQCSECGAAARCRHTGDLLAVLTKPEDSPESVPAGDTTVTWTPASWARTPSEDNPAIVEVARA